MESSGNGERGQQRLVFFIDPFNIRAGERVGNFIKANQVAENRVGTVWWQNLKKSTKSSLTLAKIHISQYLANVSFSQNQKSHQARTLCILLRILWIFFRVFQILPPNCADSILSNLVCFNEVPNSFSWANVEWVNKKCQPLLSSLTISTRVHSRTGSTIRN